MRRWFMQVLFVWALLSGAWFTWSAPPAPASADGIIERGQARAMRDRYLSEQGPLGWMRLEWGKRAGQWSFPALEEDAGLLASAKLETVALWP